MIKYHLSALALKGFSCCKPARSVYRGLGNWLGARKRTVGKMPSYYFERVERNVTWCRKYRPLRADDLILELGTGWVHWEALTLRLFFDFRAVLYDVWDNRQLRALKSFVQQLEQRFGQSGFLPGCDFDRARSLIRKIEGTESFDDLYKILGFRYVLDPSGMMESLPSATFCIVISAGVLEHIQAATAPQFVSNMASLLVRDGLGIHGINIGDHLSYYDRSANPKQYLSYSESKWKLWYENRVQYFNRIQRNGWLRMFAQAGFSILEERVARADLTGMRIAPQYQGLSREDLECENQVLVVRKTRAAGSVPASGEA
jgi:hypothetical protein